MFSQKISCDTEACQEWSYTLQIFMPLLLDPGDETMEQ